MQLLERPSQLTPETQDREALIKEARRLRRRRWALGISSGLLVIGLGGGLAVALSSRTPPKEASASAANRLPHPRVH